jgi:hypothetical protein
MPAADSDDDEDDGAPEDNVGPGEHNCNDGDTIGVVCSTGASSDH